MKKIRIRNIAISVFVAVWLGVFHYESVRYFYLQPHFSRTLPKVPLLFPPAGWIMFFNVRDGYASAEVYGQKQKALVRIDPHEILRTRWIGYDNIHRNVLSSVLDSRLQPSFCGFLNRKFPEYDDFLITQVYYPRLTQQPRERLEEVVYRCR